MKTWLMAVVVALAWLASLSCGGGGASGPTVRLVLAPEEGVQIDDLDSALENVRDVVERRAHEFDFDVVDVDVTDEIDFVIEVRGVTRDEALDSIGRTGLLQFCEPVMNDTGDVAVATGDFKYRPQTCDPIRDGNGNIEVTGGTIAFVPWTRSFTAESQRNPRPDQIVWQPAKADVDGRSVDLDSRLIEHDTFVSTQGPLNQPVLLFNLTDKGASVFEQVTSRLAQREYPIALFLDGEPLLDAGGGRIAPRVQGVITDQGVISGIEEVRIRWLSALLNSGAYPFAVREGPLVP